jgi:hypothetical protein
MDQLQGPIQAGNASSDSASHHLGLKYHSLTGLSCRVRHRLATGKNGASEGKGMNRGIGNVWQAYLLINSAENVWSL